VVYRKRGKMGEKGIGCEKGERGVYCRTQLEKLTNTSSMGREEKHFSERTKKEETQPNKKHKPKTPTELMSFQSSGWRSKKDRITQI